MSDIGIWIAVAVGMYALARPASKRWPWVFGSVLAFAILLKLLILTMGTPHQYDSAILAGNVAALAHICWRGMRSWAT